MVDREEFHDGLDRGVSPYVVPDEPVIEKPGSVAPDKSSAAIDAAESRRMEITKQIASGKLTEQQRTALTTELRNIVAKQTSTEEQQALHPRPRIASRAHRERRQPLQLRLRPHVPDPAQSERRGHQDLLDGRGRAPLARAGVAPPPRR
jgi:hypothetical protein